MQQSLSLATPRHSLHVSSLINIAQPSISTFHWHLATTTTPLLLYRVSHKSFTLASLMLPQPVLHFDFHTHFYRRVLPPSKIARQAVEEKTRDGQNVVRYRRTKPGAEKTRDGQNLVEEKWKFMSFCHLDFRSRSADLSSVWLHIFGVVDWCFSKSRVLPFLYPLFVAFSAPTKYCSLLFMLFMLQVGVESDNSKNCWSLHSNVLAIAVETLTKYLSKATRTAVEWVQLVEMKPGPDLIGIIAVSDNCGGVAARACEILKDRLNWFRDCRAHDVLTVIPTGNGGKIELIYMQVL
ncbi:Homeobox-leucine zipper protein HOX32 [Platanthera guangdongensis]|uniref:Homeobox-leucine zipper protein HOX32 n=1 Tax=Platanthera guangdongensis TaxID=2320717 RepID=A0ABR2M6G5_9ASPA